MKTSTPSSFPAGSAAGRLLDAAVVVFAREGIGRATTREIAREAGVNEVTLFRNFQTKRGLVEAVLERAFLPGEKAGPPVLDGVPVAAAVRAFAAADFERKRRNIALMRALVGESHRLGEHEQAILRRIFQPWKEKLADRLKQAQDSGSVRAEAIPAIVVDQLVAMLFVGALRVGSSDPVDYPPEAYLNSCVELVLRGILVRPENEAK